MRLAIFGAASIERNGFSFTCLAPGHVGGRIEAFVNGIPIGSSAEYEAVDLGRAIVVTCTYFPFVALPCQVRFAVEGGQTEVAPAASLRSVGEIERLVGSGRIEGVRLSVVNGAIHGTGINAVNGLGRPMLLGRINGHLLREVRMDAPRARAEGGASLSFTMAIDPADLTESGAYYEILQLPDMTIAGSLTFAREDANALAAAVTRASAAVGNLTKRLNLELARAAELAESRHSEQRELIDGVAEYLIAFVYDTLAVKADAAATGPGDRALQGFRQLMQDVAVGKAAVDRLDYGIVQPGTAFFSDGWSWLETDSKNFDFRWMGLGGTVFNPKPQRPVVQISVAIGTTFGHRAPQITAMLDADVADVELVSSPGGPPYTLKVLPRSDGRARPVHVLRLASAAVGRPSEEDGTDDQRILSIAVSGVTFYYGH